MVAKQQIHITPIKLKTSNQVLNVPTNTAKQPMKQNPQEAILTILDKNPKLLEGGSWRFYLTFMLGEVKPWRKSLMTEILEANRETKREERFGKER